MATMAALLYLEVVQPVAACATERRTLNREGLAENAY